MNNYAKLKELYQKAKENIQNLAEEFRQEHFDKIDSYTAEQKDFCFKRYGELLQQEQQKLKELERAKVFFETYLY